MPHPSKLEIITIPALEDNYYFLLHDPASQRTALIDCGDAAPVLAELTTRDWTLDEVWITHHHWDHTDGLPELSAATNAPIFGAAADAHRLPPLAKTFKPGDRFDFAGHEVQILAADGHTLGHIAYYIPFAKALFSADSLMSLGCGRLFEGTPEQMHQTIEGFAALPDDTLIYSGHEYAAANAAFAITVDPNNRTLQKRMDDIAAMRAQGIATVPSSLALEKTTNPYLRSSDPDLKAAIDLPYASAQDVFTALRSRKDHF